MRICFIISIMLVVLAGQAFAQPTIEFEGRYWMTDLQAETRVTEGTLIGTYIDLKDDMGVKDEDFPEGRFSWYTGPNSRIRLAYTSVSYSGNTDITKIIYFKGKTYAAGTNVSTEFNFDYYRLDWAWQFINIGQDKLKIGSLIGAKVFTLDASLDAPSLSLSEKESFTFGLPTAGVILDFNPFERIDLFAEISGLPSADYGHFFDAEIGIKIIPVENLTIICGYRIIDAEIEDDENFGELRVIGPFAGGTLRF